MAASGRVRLAEAAPAPAKGAEGSCLQPFTWSLWPGKAPECQALTVGPGAPGTQLLFVGTAGPAAMDSADGLLPAAVHACAVDGAAALGRPTRSAREEMHALGL